MSRSPTRAHADHRTREDRSHPAPPADPATAPWQDVRLTLHCEPAAIPPHFPPGGATTSVVVMHIPDDTPAGTYAASAAVRSETPETALDNNTTQLQIVVQHVSDLDVVKELVDRTPCRPTARPRGGSR
jgi:large repetitive protein